MSKLREEFEKASHDVWMYKNGYINYEQVEWLESKIEKSREGFKFTEDGTVLIGSTIDDGSSKKIITHITCSLCGARNEVLTYGTHYCLHCGTGYAVQEGRDE